MFNVRLATCEKILMTAIVSLCLVNQTVRAGEPVMTINGHGYKGRDFYNSDINWVSVSVRNSTGDFVTGLGLDDFVVTESIVPVGGGNPVEGPKVIDIAGQMSDENYNAGFWEDSTGDTKVDIVFVVDQTSSMEDAMPSINAEVHTFVDRLASHNVDFRIAAVGIDETPNWFDHVPFHSNQEMDAIHEGIDDIFDSAGDWWSPTTAWDALLWTPWLGYREDARKICVIITDITPQTVYGTFWYPPSSTAATLSAVELFLADTNIDVYYCLNPNEDVDFEYYSDPSINPQAGDDESGLAALEQAGLATGLRSASGADPWPFDQDILWDQLIEDGILPASPLAVTDSMYYMTWNSSLEETDDVDDNWENYREQITVQTPDPDHPGQFLTASCLNPVKQPDVEITLNLTDETGRPISDVSVNLYYPLGDHREEYFWQEVPDEDGRLTEFAAPGTYELAIWEAGACPFFYSTLRLMDRRMIEVPPGGLTLDLTVGTADREMELAKARGLVRDIRGWNVSGVPPFAAFANEADAWLDSMDENGISWLEMERIKRFYMALCGIANNSAYAQTEATQSIEDFQLIVHNILDIIDAVDDANETIEESWKQVLGKFLDIIYGLITHGEFTVNKEAVEQGLNKLLDYAEHKLVSELKEHVMEQIPAGRYKAPIKVLLDYCTDKDLDYKDWYALADAIKGLTIDATLDEASEVLSSEMVDQIFAELPDSQDQIENVVRTGVKNIIVALVRGDLDGFGDAMNEMYQSTLDYVNEADVHNYIDTLFAQPSLAVDGTLEEFVLGMAHDFAHLAVQNDDAHKYRQMDNRQFVDIMVKHTVYAVFLRRYYVEKVRIGLDEVLDRAEVFVPDGETRSDWSQAMSDDFDEYRSVVEATQDPAWDALAVQEPLDSWVELLTGFISIIDPINDALEVLSYIYPPFDGISEKLDDLVTTIEGLQIVPKAVEFGLEIDCLDDLGGKVHSLYEHALPGFSRWKSAVTVWATDVVAVEGVPDDVIEFVVVRTGDTSQDIDVNYTMLGTATNGTDYKVLTGVAMMRAGEDSTTIRVEPVADRMAEDTENVSIVLDSGGYDVGFPNFATGEIEDELLPVVSIEATVPSAIEGSFPIPTVPGEFTIRRERDTNSDVTVNYRVWGTADSGSDYDALSGSVTIPAGESSVVVPVTPRDDDTTEGNETVNLALTEGDYAVSGSTEATVYIMDNGTANSVFVNATSDIAYENGTSNGEFQITRDGSTDRDLTVQYSLEGTADDGDDYEPIEDSTTIPAGESSVTIEVIPIQDDSMEGDETVIISLIPLSSIPDEEADDYIIGHPSVATVTIVDADYTEVSVAASDAEATEGDVSDTAEFSISRIGNTSADLTVNYTMEGTAQNGVDYDFLAGTAVIPAGQKTVSVTVNTIDDSESEPAESVAISLDPGDYSIGLADTSEITIWDDDQSISSWYVSAESGNDVTGDGSQSNPWSTIGHAIDRAKLVATDSNPVTIHVGEGVFDEQVVLVPHVSLIGSGPDLTTIQHYDETDMEHVVITCAEDTAISGCKVRLDDIYETITVLVKIDETTVNIDDCVFDGNDNDLCTAIEISGTGSSDSVISNCTIEDVGTGVWAEYTGVTIGDTLFQDISGNALYVLPVLGKTSDTPYLGGLDNGRVSGMNRFRNIGGLFVQNRSGSAVQAAYNDWGVYSTDKIAGKMSGVVYFSSYLPEEISDGILFVQIVDDATGEPLSAAANPQLIIDDGTQTAVFDPDTNMFTSENMEGTYTIHASAEGYRPKDKETFVPASESVVEVVRLEPEPAVPGDVDGSGRVNAIDVQMVINEALGIDTGHDCDINGDTLINAIDVQLVINAALGISI